MGVQDTVFAFRNILKIRSFVLGRRIVNVIHVKGCDALKGEITVQGSKNAVLPILAATILINGVCVLENCPRISDVDCMLQLLRSMGGKVCWDDRGLCVDTTALCESRLPKELVSSMRSSVMLLGPLLAICKEMSMSYPGGCVIGERPIDIHLQALEELGASFCPESDGIKGKVSQFVGTHVVLRFPSVGATENVIMAAVLAKGRTVLENCAREPEVQQLCSFLNAAGACISGIGEKCLSIDGVEKLHSLSFLVKADRIVAGTYLLATAAIGGEVWIKNAPVTEMESVLNIARQLGCELDLGKEGFTVIQKARPKSLAYMETSVYPGFPTDLQSVLLTVLSVSDAESVLEEKIFSDRFHTAGELVRMGAAITIRDNCAYINGVDRLIGRHVIAEDLRGGAALVLAGLLAKGDTFINNCYYIERGYENICRDFGLLGAYVEGIG